MIRLLHDPTFAATLRADPERALTGAELTTNERTWLVEAAPAAWRTDPARPARVLAALVEEYPLTTRLGPERAAGFFASAEFHDTVQARGSLALAFGVYLARDAPDLGREVPDPSRHAPDPASARSRRSSAHCRDQRARPIAAVTNAARLRLTPRARVLRLPAGTLELAALLAAATQGRLEAGEEIVLALGAVPNGEVTLEALEPALAALLERAVPGISRKEFCAVARDTGPKRARRRRSSIGCSPIGLLVGADDLGR
jgi:hypothetical protein